MKQLNVAFQLQQQQEHDNPVLCVGTDCNRVRHALERIAIEFYALERIAIEELRFDRTRRMRQICTAGSILPAYTGRVSSVRAVHFH